MRKSTDYIIIHCAATPPSMDIGFREIDQWHRARGFLMCGYHFIITREGTVQTGRPLMDPGAHARGYNNRSIGICLVGGVSEEDLKVPEDNFTFEQYDSLRVLHKMLSSQFEGASWIGHNEVSSKECPSFDVQEWVSKIKPD